MHLNINMNLIQTWYGDRYYCVIGMHLNVYESICFKLDTMIDTIALYILTLV